MKKITTLANRLAEAILFDWDKEEVIKLAKEVAVACHENIEFISLVKRMREAQTEFTIHDGRMAYKINHNVKIEAEEYAEHSALMYQMVSLESEVDELLKKIE